MGLNLKNRRARASLVLCKRMLSAAPSGSHQDAVVSDPPEAKAVEVAEVKLTPAPAVATPISIKVVPVEPAVVVEPTWVERNLPTFLAAWNAVTGVFS